LRTPALAIHPLHGIALHILATRAQNAMELGNLGHYGHFSKIIFKQLKTRNSLRFLITQQLKTRNAPRSLITTSGQRRKKAKNGIFKKK
jgi:hypothetical protein